MPKHFVPCVQFDVAKVEFSIGSDRHSKPTIAVSYGEAGDVDINSDSAA